jgi:predicted ATPase
MQREKLGKYRIAREIGRGAMGAIYEALTPYDERVAVKTMLMPPDLPSQRQWELVDRFLMEARAIRRLEHPNVVRVLDTGVDRGDFFIVMEFLDGRSLRQVLRERGPLPAVEAIELFGQVCAALGYAHRLGVIHRDVKPDNILLTTDGTVKLTDFGLARIGDWEAKEEGGYLYGTLPYMPPEVIRGKPVGARSDVFSAGATLYELVAGRTPFRGGDSPVVLATIPAEPPRPLTGVPAPLEAVILRCLEKEPDQRYADASELGQGLRAALAELSGEPPAPDAPRRTVESGPASTVHGQPIVTRSRAPAPASPAPGSSSVLDRRLSGRGRIPVPATRCLGRDEEIAGWQQRLEAPETRLLTLLGSAGIGKTRAALRLAELVEERYPDGAWWIDLSAARTAEELLQTTMAAVQLEPLPGIDHAEQLGAFLAERRLLLLLDNLEQIPDAGPALAGLLSAAPSLQCVVTSRRALEIRGESLFYLGPLAAPDAEALFLERARARQVDPALLEGCAAEISAICWRLEAVPLAIELAASRLVVMSPHEILEGLNEPLTLLRTRASDLPPRQRALRAAIDWSYALLADEDGALFAALSVFAGSFTVRDARALGPDWDTVEGLAELRRHSLVQAETDPVTRETRFRMLESLREFAREKREEDPSAEEALRLRHARYFLSFAEQRLRKLRTGEGPAALRQLAAATADLQAAAAWSGGRNDPDLTAGLLLALAQVWWWRGFLGEALAAVEDALRRLAPVRDAHPARYARLLVERSGLHLDHSEWDAAAAGAQEALALFASLDDLEGQGRAENLLGLAAAGREAYVAAREHYSRAIAFCERIDDRAGLGIAYNNLGLIAASLPDGSAARAAEYLGEAERCRREIQDLRGLADTLNNLGVLSQEQGDWAGAWRRYAEALQAEQTLGHTLGAGRVLYNLGEVAGAKGSTAGALRLFLGAEHLLKEAQSPLSDYASAILPQAAAEAACDPEAVERFRRSLRAFTLDETIAWSFYDPDDRSKEQPGPA